MRSLGSSVSGLPQTQIGNISITFIETNEVTKMEYMIAFSVAAMMGLYVLILGHYLKDA